MDSSRIFAIIIWVNDDPVTGNVLNVSNIVEPRKDFSEYCVGDQVKAKCPGFGVHQGVIVMLRPADQRKQLENVLKGDSDQFAQLVAKHSKKRKEPESHTPKTSTKIAKEPKQQPKSKKPKTKDDSSTKKSQKNLETVAKQLELTELQAYIENEENLPVSQVYRESMTTLLSTDEPTQPTQETCIDCTILQEQVNCNSQEINTLKTQLHSSKTDLQNLQAQYCNLQYYMQIIWNNYQSQQQRYSCVPVLPTQPKPSESQNKTPAVDTPAPSPVPEPVSSPITVHQEDTAGFESMETQSQVETSFFNNYSQEILEAKVSRIKDYSKCAKILLRLLYSDTERQGRSLSGIAANNKHPARPALDHQERLDVIYDIINKRWPNTSIPTIKAKLAETLKPSAGGK